MWWASRSRLNLAHSIRSRFLLSWATSAIFLFRPISIVLYFIRAAGSFAASRASREWIVQDQSRDPGSIYAMTTRQDGSRERCGAPLDCAVHRQDENKLRRLALLSAVAIGASIFTG